jgi:hypothetical protein
MTDRKSLVQKDHDHLIHPQHHPSEHLDPQIWVSGEHALITNLEGRTYFDGLSGMWNVAVGHGRRELVDAAASQMAKLPFATAYAGATNWPAIQLARKLKDRGLLFHARGIGRHGYVDPDGAVLLDREREAGEAENHRAQAFLPRLHRRRGLGDRGG